MLGPIFKAQGWKGRYMVRDIERLAAARGLFFSMPEVFPRSGLKAARLAITAQSAKGIAAFSRAVFSAQFAHVLNIAEHGVSTASFSGAMTDWIRHSTGL